jgi:hypothetical protein
VPVWPEQHVHFIKPLIQAGSSDYSIEYPFLDEAGNTGNAAIYTTGMKKRC